MMARITSDCAVVQGYGMLQFECDPARFAVGATATLLHPLSLL